MFTFVIIVYYTCLSDQTGMKNIPFIIEKTMFRIPAVTIAGISEYLFTYNLLLEQSFDLNNFSYVQGHILNSVV